MFAYLDAMWDSDDEFARRGHVKGDYMPLIPKPFRTRLKSGNVDDFDLASFMLNGQVHPSVRVKCGRSTGKVRTGEMRVQRGRIKAEVRARCG